MLRPEIRTLLQQTGKLTENAPSDNRLVMMLVMNIHIINFTFWNIMLDIVESEVKKQGYTFCLNVVDNEQGDWLKVEADGYILLGVVPLECCEKIRQKNKPLVWIDSNHEALSCCQVRINNEGGAYQMTQKAIDMGHRRLLLLTSTMYLSYAQRSRGMLRCAQDNRWRGVTYEELPTKLLSEQQHSLVDKLIYRQMPTCILTAADSEALNVYRVVESLKLTIPDDLSVVGFDNAEGARSTVPPLTTIDSSRIEMAIAAVDALIKQFHTGRITDESIRIEPTLIVRQSLAPPRP